MADARCRLYDIVRPRSTSIPAIAWINIQERMMNSSWSGEPGGRFGFVNTAGRQEIIGGYFAHEGKKTGIQYDEHKQPEDAFSDSFEHLFFSIFTDTSQILLQHKNVYGYANLKLATIRNRFLRSLAAYLIQEGINVKNEIVEIEPAGIRYSQQELYEFFASNNTLKLEVKNLRADRIPQPGAPNYNLYNPKDEWNAITWGAVAETEKFGAKNVTIEAEHDGSQLNKGPLVKAMARIGEIEQVTAKTPNNVIVVRKRTNDEEIEITLPSRPSVSQPILDTILTRFENRDRVNGWHQRIEQRAQDELRGTMFDIQSGSS